MTTRSALAAEVEAETGFDTRAIAVCDPKLTDIGYVLEGLDEEGDVIGYWKTWK